MGKGKSKKSAPAASKTPTCTCDDPYKCSCGNRPERPSKGHKWYPEEQIWAGKGHKQKGASGQIASKATEAKVTTKGKTSVEQWQRMPSQLLADFCQRQRRPPAKYKMLSAYRFRVIVKDSKNDDRDLLFVPANSVSNEEQAKEEAALLALLQLTPTLPHERKLPEPYRTTWLNAVEARKKQIAESKTKSSQSESEKKPQAQSVLNNQGQKAQASTRLVSAVTFASPAEKRKVQMEKQRQRTARIRKREAVKMANMPHQVFMSATIRRQIELLLRGSKEIDLDADDDEVDVDVDEDEDSDEAKATVIHKLCTEGFTRKQARFAHSNIENPSGDWEDMYEQCLQWLLVHLDEDQLPVGFDPRGQTLDVVTSTKAADTTDVTELAQRLGVSQQDAALIARSANTQKIPPLDAFWELCCRAAGTPSTEQPSAAESDIDLMLQDEKDVLESIFDSSFSTTNGDNRELVRIADETLTVEVMLDPNSYPRVRPSRVIVDGAGFSLHVELARFMNELPFCEPMVFVLHTQAVSLLETDLPASSVAKFLKSSSLRPSEVQETRKTSEPVRPERISLPKRRPRSRRNNFWSTSPEKTPSAVAYPDSNPSIQKTRKSLPAAKSRAEFLEALKKADSGGRVLLVTGETGSGKSTQLPAYILEANPNNAKIVVAQPRRLAATGVASRVAEERGESRPGIHSVGYVVRGDSATSANTRLLFCTTGILLRQLQSEGALECITHIVVDEVHERHLDSDILLGLLKENLAMYPNLRVILMSATLDKEKFETYWESKPPHIHIPGRTFPVTDLYLEDVLRLTGHIPPKRGGVSNRRTDDQDDELNNDEPSLEEPPMDINGIPIDELVARMDQSQVDYSLLAKLIAHLIQIRTPSDDGSILVFLAGAPEIGRAMDSIKKATRGMSLTLLQLHGGLQPREQNRVFERAQRGFTKVILSTNVAETSITIPDVTIAIDTCREKQSSYDPTNRMPMLVEKFASKASLRQRRGRAGRVRAGTAYRLISRKKFEGLDSHSEPEIKRVALDQTLLQLLFIGVENGSGRFMQKLLDPPKGESLDAAIYSLTKLGAIEPREDAGVVLLPLGMHLAGIPAPPMIGKLLVMGSILGCRDASLAMAAGLSVGRNPFLRVNTTRPGRRGDSSEVKSIEDDKNESILKERESLFKHVGNSDHAVLAAILLRFKNCDGGKQKRFCDSLGLSFNSMRDIHQLYKQLDTALVSGGFEHDAGANRNAQSWRLIHACAVAAMAPSQLVKLWRPPTKYHETAEGAKEKDGEARELRFFIRVGESEDGGKPNVREERVFVHPASASFSQGNYSFPFLVYHSLVRTSKPFLRDITEATAYSLLLFGGNIEVRASKETIVIDDWVELSANPKIGALVGGLRSRVDALLSEKIENPSAEVSSSIEMRLIAKLIRTDGLGK